MLPLLEDGFEVHGFDASEHILKKLYHKATIKNLKPRGFSRIRAIKAFNKNTAPDEHDEAIVCECKK